MLFVVIVRSLCSHLHYLKWMIFSSVKTLNQISWLFYPLHFTWDLFLLTDSTASASFFHPFVLNLPVEPSNVELSGSSEAVEGTEVNLCCSTSSSNPPVQIRWSLGFKELNTTVITVTEVKDSGLYGESDSPTENGLNSKYYYQVICFFIIKKKNIFLLTGTLYDRLCYSNQGQVSNRKWFIYFLALFSLE